MTPYRRHLTEAMENQTGVIYLWNGQEIEYFRHSNCEHTTITKRVKRKSTHVSFVPKISNRVEKLISSH